MPSPSPTKIPSSATPTNIPSSATPTNIPSTATPTMIPSPAPTPLPNPAPSRVPSRAPSFAPSVVPSSLPSFVPSVIPTVAPSSVPTGTPSAPPSSVPTAPPSSVPTGTPSAPPSSVPTVSPSGTPSSPPSPSPSFSPDIVVNPIPSPVPTTRMNVTWYTVGRVPSATLVDVELRSCNASAPVGATLAEDVPASRGYASWEPASVCPATAEGAYVECVKVAIDWTVYTDADVDRQSFSNRLSLDCTIPGGGGGDGENSLARGLAKNAAWFVPASVVVVVCASLFAYGSYQRRRAAGDEEAAAPLVREDRPPPPRPWWCCWPGTRKGKRGLRGLIDCSLETDADVWILDYERLRLGEMVGVGSTAAVFKSTYAGATVAAKRIPCFDWNGPEREHLLREASVLARLHHPNIVGFFGVVVHSQHVYIITEFVEETLASRIDRAAKAATPSRLPLAEYVDLALGISFGLEFLHSRRTAHRDVKPSNVLVRGHHARLCDFGLSKRAECASVVTNTTGVGTPSFMAPEIITGQATKKNPSDSPRFSAPPDVFGFAMVLWSAWTCRLPFETTLETRAHLSPFVVMSKTARGDRPDIPEDMIPALAKLVRRCWAQLPADRPLMPEVVADLGDLANRQTNVRASCAELEDTAVAARLAASLSDRTTSVDAAVLSEPCETSSWLVVGPSYTTHPASPRSAPRVLPDHRRRSYSPPRHRSHLAPRGSSGPPTPPLLPVLDEEEAKEPPPDLLSSSF